MLMVMNLLLSHHFLFEFVEYFHTHEDGYNSMEARTLEALDLRATVNSQDRKLLPKPPYWIPYYAL